MAAKRFVTLYDTTLRDGSQREGLSLSVKDKISIAHKLDQFGIAYIEGGWPGANPKDNEFFETMRSVKLENAKLVAFASTRRKGTPVEEDPNMRALIEAATPTVCIFGKAWDMHVTHALVTTLDENLRMIAESVEHLKKQGLEVVYDAEHFFDGYRDNPAYAMETVKAAEDAGADCIVLCDTNGGFLPQQVEEIVREVKPQVGPPLGMHAHNDSGCAVANTLVAVREGVSHVQGTINGYGERCGNADLVSIVPGLALKMGIDCIPGENLKLLTELAHHVSEVANITPDANEPYVGENAFAHKGGVHVSATLRAKGTYEHIDPQLVGNIQRIAVSEQAGIATILERAREAGIELNDEQAKNVLDKLKKLEHRGYHFEAADASFEMLLRRTKGEYRPLFKLEEYRVNVGKRSEKGVPIADAIVKIHVGGRRHVEHAEGDGPVNALDMALRKAMGNVYPDVYNIRLTDYKVRIVNAKRGTAAMTRVLIQSSDGEDEWGTVGVSENIIEASWDALVESIEYGLTRKK
ncbi:MAG: citramalate synthase [Actinobacteria bacterium]|nr:MAG: citramalate synthase [Actinomycetota bacterium]